MGCGCTRQLQTHEDYDNENSKSVDELHHANTSRKFATGELLLVERHHIGTPNSRCTNDCEPAHLMAARAALLEASRLKGGTNEDKELAQKIERLNLHKDESQLQQEVRSIRKDVMKLAEGNVLVSGSMIDKFPDENSGSSGVKIILFLAGSFLMAEATMSIIYSQDKKGISQAGRIARLLIGAGLIYGGLRK